jgi:mannitol-1-phosphate/altronate dehydrogenase
VSDAIPALRIADALERIADALERIATEPSGKLPARKRSQRREHVARVAEPVDELARAKARKALERVGLR